MPRKLRTPKTRVAALPSPAWTSALLIGADPGCRLPGWVAMAQEGRGEPAAPEMWTRHRDALIAEAMAAGFEPYALTQRQPRGPAADAWCRDCVARHRY